MPCTPSAVPFARLYSACAGDCSRPACAARCSSSSFSGRRCRPQIVEPVKVRLHEVDVDVRVEIVGRHDVDQHGLRDVVGVIERHPVGDAAAAILADDREPVEAEVLHDVDLVLRHRALRIVRMIGQALRLAAVAVAAQVAGDDGEVLGELRARRRATCTASTARRAAAATAGRCRL